MTLHFAIERNPDFDSILFLRLTGRMTLGPHLLEFSKSVTGAIQSQHSRAILLDLSGVEAIDSAGLGELVILYTAAGQSNCRLGLLDAPANIVRLLKTTRLEGILPHFEGTASGIAWIRAAH